MTGTSRWAVVGGGMLGMSLALRLAEAGRRVTLFEAAEGLGGVADAWQLGVPRWDRHYHVICASDRRTRRLLGRLDLDGDLHWATTRSLLWDGHRLLPITTTAEILANLPFGVFDKARLGALMLATSLRRDRRRLEQVPIEHWLVRWCGRRVFEGLWRPLLAAKLGDGAGEASAAFLWAVIRRLSAARRSGLDRERFGYVSGGYGRIVERFGEALEKAGVELCLGTKIRRVEAGAAPRILADGLDRAFDGVAVTLAAPLVAHLVDGLDEALLGRLRAVRSLGIICPSLLLRRPLGGAYLTYLTDTTLPFSAIVESSSMIDRQRELGGHHLVYLPKYLLAGDPLFELPDEQIASRFLGGLRRLYPDLADSDILTCRLSRVRHLMPLPTLGYSRSLPGQDLAPGVWWISSAHITDGTHNVDEVLGVAERAARRLLAGAPP